MNKAGCLVLILPSLHLKEEGKIGSGKSSRFHYFLPVIIDEYKPYAMGKHRVDLITNVMRNSYDVHVVMKGVAILKKNREFNGRASVILCG